MCFIEIYFNSSLKKTVDISGTTVSLGRAAHNQIQIDNKGVSLVHAVLTKVNNNWFIEDLNSTNGTFLNNIKVEGRQAIKFGDTISICKHQLKFVNHGSQSATENTNTEVEDADRTIVLQGHQPTSAGPKLHNCQLLVRGESRNIQKILLNRSSYTIGKSNDNDLRVGGWFTPAMVAEISRLGDSYYLTPLANRLIKINGRKPLSRVKLTNDDNIIIKKLHLKFVEE